MFHVTYDSHRAKTLHLVDLLQKYSHTGLDEILSKTQPSIVSLV